LFFVDFLSLKYRFWMPPPFSPPIFCPLSPQFSNTAMPDVFSLLTFVARPVEAIRFSNFVCCASPCRIALSVLRSVFDFFFYAGWLMNFSLFNSGHPDPLPNTRHVPFLHYCEKAYAD